MTALARLATRALLTTLLFSAAGVALAQKAPVEGVDYRIVSPAQAVEVPAGKIEVIEFFWYGCPHCNALEPTFNEWVKKQPADVVVRRVPVAYNDALVPHQRLYYALDALGKEPELRAKVFAAIHVEHNRLDNQELMGDFAAKNGVDRKKFIDTYNSFSVQSKTRRAAQVAEAFGVDGVPMIGIGGHYLASVQIGTLGTIDYLIAKERATMKPAAEAKPAEKKTDKKAEKKP